MRFVSASWLLCFVAAAVVTRSDDGGTPRPRAGNVARGVAYFEPPRSVGTPLDDLVRTYTGHALADRIAGRIMLDTDASLRPVTRELIRRRLAQGR